jgi:Arc/MetJ family transcription regulator
MVWCIVVVYWRCTMARMSVTIDPALIEEAQRLAQVGTKREAIERALQEFIRHHRLQELQVLAGSGLVEMDLAELRRWRQSGDERP